MEHSLFLKSVSRRDTKGVFYAALGREQQMGGDVEGAERSYLAALRYAKDEETALNNLGVIYALRGDDRAALDLFLHLLRVASDHNVACRNIRALSARLQVSESEVRKCPRKGARAKEGSSPSSAGPNRAVTLGTPG